jgi:hypothetical protein
MEGWREGKGLLASCKRCVKDEMLAGYGPDVQAFSAATSSALLVLDLRLVGLA